jgi:hypothetical protein
MEIERHFHDLTWWVKYDDIKHLREPMTKEEAEELVGEITDHPVLSNAILELDARVKRLEGNQNQFDPLMPIKMPPTGPVKFGPVLNDGKASSDPGGHLPFVTGLSKKEAEKQVDRLIKLVRMSEIKLSEGHVEKSVDYEFGIANARIELITALTGKEG